MRRALVGLLVVLAVAPAVLGAAGGQSLAETDPGNMTLAELQERGQQIEGADPSRRWLGERGSVYVSYQETNLVKQMGSDSPEWAVDKVVSSDKTVDTNEVKLHFDRPRGAGEKTINVVTIAWKTEQKEVEQGNTTTTETQVVDVRRQSTEVRLTDPMETATVDLPDTEEQQFVTMYVEEYPGARWVFPHDPIALADSLPFGTSWGSYLGWFATRFLLLTAIGVPVAIGGAYKTLEYTHTGPGKGVLWWLIAGGLLSYLALYFSHGTVAVVLTSAPWIMGLFVDGIAYVATLELADPTEEARFESVVTTDAQNPLGDELPDISEEWAEHLHYVQKDDGIALVKPSLTFFITLLAGADPPTLSLSDLKTRVKSRGSSPEDEKFYGREPENDADDVDPELVYVQWPALQFGPEGLRRQVDQVGLPGADGVEDGDSRTVTTAEWDRDRLVRAGLFGLLTGAVANVALGGIGYAILGVAVGAFASTVRRVDGSASFDPAPAHSTAAKARAVTEQQELAIAETFEELQQKVAEADATTTEQAVDIAEAYIGQLRGQIDRLIGGDDSGGLPGDGSAGPSPDTTGPSRETGVSDD
jgi:hypothetical protein